MRVVVILRSCRSSSEPCAALSEARSLSRTQLLTHDAGVELPLDAAHVVDSLRGRGEAMELAEGDLCIGQILADTDDEGGAQVDPDPLDLGGFAVNGGGVHSFGYGDHPPRLTDVGATDGFVHVLLPQRRDLVRRQPADASAACEGHFPCHQQHERHAQQREPGELAAPGQGDLLPLPLSGFTRGRRASTSHSCWKTFRCPYVFVTVSCSRYSPACPGTAKWHPTA